VSKPNTTGISVRHERKCSEHRADGKCCKARFQARAYDARAGKRIPKTFATVSAATRWKHDAQVALRRGEISADRGITVTEAAERWLDAARAGQVCNRSGDPFKASAIRSYEKEMRLRALPALGDLRLSEVTTHDVQKFIDGMVMDGFAPATIDSALTPLRTIYRRAVARGEVRVNPTLRIEKPAVRSKPKRIASPEQAAQMLAVLEPADRVLWAVTFYAGLRRGELIGLYREDVNLASGKLRVERGWDLVDGEAIAPKSRQGRRTIPICAVLRDYLDQHLLTTSGQRVFGTPNWVCKANDRARKRWEASGLPVLTLHEGRHTCASLWIAANVNIKALSVFMGHANIGITLDLYGHLLPGSEEEAADLLDVFLARAATGAHTGAHPAESTV